jgi:methylated-DNA-[protein]-cysteine S-methyltransferase
VARQVRYAVDGWGVGELWYDGNRLLHSELPQPNGGPPDESDPPPAVAALVDSLRAFFRGDRVDFRSVELDLEGATQYEEAVIAALRGVPWGEVVTYGELAALAGRPGAHRAAGSVCARNRFSIVVPCHRVVAAGGIGGYGSLGVGVKRRLLALEGVEL